jgi:hypothetical protein
MLRYDKQVGRLISKDDYINENIGGLPNADMLAEIWERLPSQYDSEVDTLKHIKRVNELLLFACQDLLKRAMRHDDSKLIEPEKSRFDNVAPKLNTLEFGSEDYKSSLDELGIALKHHYENNSHHPEHYDEGINDMDLLDLIEMFFDWCAASERTKDGNIYVSINTNKDRFNISKQLAQIFRNTAKRYYRKYERLSNY